MKELRFCKKNGTKFTLTHNVSKQITFKVFVLSFMCILCFHPVMSQDPGATEKRVFLATDDQEDDKKEISLEDLPENVSKDVLKNYPGSEIMEVWKWLDETGETKRYEIKVHNEGKDFYLNYTKDGKALKIEE